MSKSELIEEMFSLKAEQGWTDETIRRWALDFIFDDDETAVEFIEILKENKWAEQSYLDEEEDAIYQRIHVNGLGD